MGSSSSISKSTTYIDTYVVDEFKYEWTISKFKNLLSEGVGYSVYSDVLTLNVGNEDDTYKVVLYPNGFNERVKGYASLWLQKISTKERMINFTCTIVDAKGGKLLEKSLKQVLNIESFLGWMTFCPRNILLEQDGKVLKDDNLTLQCVLQIFSDKALANAEADETGMNTSLSHLSSNLSNLIINKDFHDFYLLVQSEKIYVHRAILGTRSPIFDAMFKSPLTVENFIEITDISEHIIREMLNFIYTGKVGCLTLQDATDLYYAADKYGICNLKKICSKVIKASLEANNVLNALLLSDKHSDVELQEVCIAYIVKNASKVQDQEEWMEFLKTQPSIANLVFKRIISKTR